MIIGTIMLVLIPILSASVTLFIRHLKALSEITIGSIMTFGILFLYGPIAYFNEDTGELLQSFDNKDWLLALGLGLTSSIVQIAKTKAL
jgi:hypothetical protein